MSETCIVCLGDLGENASALPLSVEEIVNDVDAKIAADGVVAAAAAASAAAVDDDVQKLSPLRSPAETSKSLSADPELIAHLLPCGHYLHDECLKPWVERANSCPICRQTFNQVELIKEIGGPVLSSYPVQDRVQVAELDPSLLLEIEDQAELDLGPCQVCGSDEDEDVLLICEGCDKAWHIYCIGLQDVPAGNWYCEACALPRAIEASYATAQGVASARYPVRTRAEVRRNRNNILARSSDWARVWESIRDRTTIDLDFPYHIDQQTTPPRPRTNWARERRAWEQRLRIAEEQGNARQLRNIAPIFDYDSPVPSRPRPEPEEPESMEEILAWNAMEKARDIEADPGVRSRKRRRTDSVTASPASPRPPPDPVPRKRPRIRRPNDPQEVLSDVGESSLSRRPQAASHSVPNAVNGVNGGPSFLQSLLREVESSAADDETRGRPRLSLRAASDHASPQGSSPEASPTSSNAPSPRAGSASPVRTRPGSPLLTSRIEPIYPHLGPNGEPAPAPAPPPAPALGSPLERPKLKPKSRLDSSSRTKDWVETTDSVSNAQKSAAELSPTRLNMSLSAKERIQRLVKEALRDPYQRNLVDKEQYTDINRNVSRMLYDEVGENGDVDGDESVEWQQLATMHVARAVAALQQASTDPPS